MTAGFDQLIVTVAETVIGNIVTVMTAGRMAASLRPRQQRQERLAKGEGGKENVIVKAETIIKASQ